MVFSWSIRCLRGFTNIQACCLRLALEKSWIKIRLSCYVLKSSAICYKGVKGPLWGDDPVSVLWESMQSHAENIGRAERVWCVWSCWLAKDLLACWQVSLRKEEKASGSEFAGNELLVLKEQPPAVRRRFWSSSWLTTLLIRDTPGGGGSVLVLKHVLLRRGCGRKYCSLAHLPASGKCQVMGPLLLWLKKPHAQWAQPDTALK